MVQETKRRPEGKKMSLTQDQEGQSVANEEGRGDKRGDLRMTISYGELKVELSGSPESVLQSVNSLLAKQIPALKLAQRISLNYTASELIDSFQEFVRVTPEGPRVTASGLSDKQILALQLAGQRISFETGNAKTTTASLSEIQETTGLKPKTISSRLSELSKEGRVVRETDDSGGTAFRISTIGVKWLQDSLVRKKANAKD